MDFDRLRFVSERADASETLMSVEIPEKAGSFRRFISHIEPQRGQSAPPALAAPQLGSCASSGHAWRLWAARLWAARHSQEEAVPQGAPPLLRVLELAASKAAYFTAFDHVGAAQHLGVLIPLRRQRARLHPRLLPGQGARRRRGRDAGAACRWLQRDGPHRERARQGPREAPGGRPLSQRGRRATLPLRVP